MYHAIPWSSADHMQNTHKACTDWHAMHPKPQQPGTDIAPYMSTPTRGGLRDDSSGASSLSVLGGHQHIAQAMHHQPIGPLAWDAEPLLHDLDDEAMLETLSVVGFDGVPRESGIPHNNAGPVPVVDGSVHHTVMASHPTQSPPVSSACMHGGVHPPMWGCAVPPPPMSTPPMPKAHTTMSSSQRQRRALVRVKREVSSDSDNDMHANEDDDSSDGEDKHGSDGVVPKQVCFGGIERVC